MHTLRYAQQLDNHKYIPWLVICSEADASADPTLLNAMHVYLPLTSSLKGGWITNCRPLLRSWYWLKWKLIEEFPFRHTKVGLGVPSAWQLKLT